MIHGTTASQLRWNNGVPPLPDGFRYGLTMGENDYTIPRLIDIETGSLIAELPEGSAPSCLTTYPGGDWLLVAGEQVSDYHEQEINLFNLAKSFNPLGTFKLDLTSIPYGLYSRETVRLSGRYNSRTGNIHVVALITFYANGSGGRVNPNVVASFVFNPEAVIKGSLQTIKPVISQQMWDGSTNTSQTIYASPDLRWVMTSWQGDSYSDRVKKLFSIASDGSLKGPYPAPYGDISNEMLHSVFVNSVGDEGRFLMIKLDNGYSPFIELWGIRPSGEYYRITRNAMTDSVTSVYFINVAPNGEDVMLVPNGGCGSYRGFLLCVKDDVITQRGHIEWNSNDGTNRWDNWWNHDSTRYYFGGNQANYRVLDITTLPEEDLWVNYNTYPATDTIPNNVGYWVDDLIPIAISKDLGNGVPVVDPLEGFDHKYIVTMVDDFGDGWNGGQLKIIVDGVETIHDFTSGSEKEIPLGVMGDLILVEFQIKAGQYAGEMRIRIQDAVTSEQFIFTNSGVYGTLPTTEFTTVLELRTPNTITSTYP